MQTPGRPTVRNTSISVGGPWWFFGVTYSITWGFLLVAIALGVSFRSAEGVVLQLLALLGPGIAGIGFVYHVYDDRGRADFWNRIKQPRRIGVRWFLIILLIPVGVTTVATIGATLLGDPSVAWGVTVRELRSNPLALLPALFFATLPPILEEFGWRGYALDRLQMDHSAFGASLLLGVVWAVWHLPLFFVRGSFQREFVGFATTGFWLFMIGIVALSVIFIWVYNHTSRSILGIILLHGWVNFVSETVAVADKFYYSIWVLLAVVITLLWGAETLTKTDDVPRPPLTADEARG